MNLFQPAPVKISCTQRTLQMSYSVPDTVPGIGAKVSKAAVLSSGSSHPHTGTGVKQHCAMNSSVPRTSGNAADLDSQFMIYKSGNLCRSRPQSGLHHQLELMSYWPPRQSKSKTLHVHPAKWRGQVDIQLRAEAICVN